MNIVLSCVCIPLSAVCCVITGLGNLGEVPTISDSTPKSEPITVKIHLHIQNLLITYMCSHDECNKSDMPLHLTYSDSATWSSPIFWRATATHFHAGEDFLSHTSRISFRHSSSVSLLVKISSMRSSSIPNTSPSCCHLAAAGCTTAKRLSKLTELCWFGVGWSVAHP